jgi:spermidine/putrescine transport system substrate-binding protein
MDSRLSDLGLEPPEGVYTRRHFLRLAGGTALAVAGGGLLSASEAVASLEAVGGALNLFTWQGYDLTQPFKEWRKQHHIHQTVKYINNQFDVASILRGPGGKQFDSSSANQAYTHLFQQLGIMSPLTPKEVPSLAKMYPFFRDSPIWRWGGGSSAYNSAPWTWGAIGINYLTDRVPKPTSWRVLIDPKNKGRVGTFDDAYNNVSIAAIALGIPLTHITHAQLNGPIKNWLLKLKSNLKSISPNLGDQTTLLVNKEVDYMSVGLTLFVQMGKQQGANDIGFVVPKEGGFGFCDAAFVTPGAPHKENAYAFIEAILGGKTAALAANNLQQAVSCPDAVKYLTPQTRALYPYSNLQTYLSKKLKFAVNYTPKKGQDIVSFKEINDLWTHVKAA